MRASKKNRSRIWRGQLSTRTLCHQGPLGTPDGELAEVPPVHLGLLARQGFEAQIRLRQGAWSVMQHQVAKVVRPTRVAALAHHGVEAAGGERRVLLQGRLDKGQIRVQERRPMGSLQLWQPGLREHPIHRAMGDAQLPGDGPRQPLLDMEVAQDLGFEFRRNGQGRFLARATPGPV